MPKTTPKIMNKVGGVQATAKPKAGQSRLCAQCGCDYTHHDVFPGGKCGGCHDKQTGFKCNGFKK